MAGVTSQMNLSKVNMYTLGPGGPTSQSRCYWSNAAHTPLLGHTLFQAPQDFILHGNLGSICILLSSQELPWGFCLLRDGTTADLLGAQGAGSSGP